MLECQKQHSRGNEMTDGPFKATKLWNQIIYDFSTGISLKRHRRHLRAYENCFVASKAVDWLYEYLSTQKRNENKQISRQQAVQLLDKFLSYDIIEKVVAKNVSCSKFKDNKDLYRLKNENIPFPHLESSRDTEEEVSCRGEKMMERQWNSNNKSSPFMGTKAPTQSTNGSVSPVKSLTLTFESNSSHIWKEVLVRQISLIQPLLTSLLDPKEIDSKFASINSTHINKNGIVLVDDKTKDIPHWVMSAMKCLANWPNNSGNSLPRYPGFERDVFNLIREYFVNLGSPMIPSIFYPLLVSLIKESDLQTIYRQRSGQLYSNVGLENREPIYESNTSTPLSNKKVDGRRLNGISSKVKKDDSIFETVFHPQSPVSRILSHDQLTSIFSSIASSDGSLDGSSSPQSIEALYSWRKPTEARNLQHLATLPRNLRKQRIEGLKRYKLEKEPFKSSLCLMNFGCILQSPCEEGEYMMDKSVTSLQNWRSFRVRSPEPTYTSLFNRDIYGSTTKNECLNEGDENIVNLLNLTLLLIPPENRRHLHLLLRLLSRILKNSELKFLSNHSSSMEYYIVETFTRCIIFSGNEKTYNEPAAQYLVSVMLKNVEQIFGIPSSVKYQVNSILSY